MARILVVDDERGAAAALSRLLRLDGYEATAFESAAAARAVIETEPFDAVITDLEMPGIHGLDIVRAARRARPDAPVFVITGYGNAPMAQTVIDVGAVGVFGKPIDYDDIHAALRAALGERS
jgi:DNA-binding NtrC family response regulator